MSLAMVVPVVVSISPLMAEFAPDWKQALPSSPSSSRPPASLIAAWGENEPEDGYEALYFFGA